MIAKGWQALVTGRESNPGLEDQSKIEKSPKEYA